MAGLKPAHNPHTLVCAVLEDPTAYSTHVERPTGALGLVDETRMRSPAPASTGVMLVLVLWLAACTACTTPAAASTTMTPVLVLIGTTDLASCNATTAVNQQILSAKPDACTSTGTPTSASSVWVNCTGRYVMTYSGNGNCGGTTSPSSGSSGTVGTGGTKTSFSCSNGMFYQCASVPSNSLVSGAVYGDTNCTSSPLARTLTQVDGCTLVGSHQSVRLSSASATSVTQTLYNTTSCSGNAVGSETFQTGKCTASGLAGTHVVLTQGFSWPVTPSGAVDRHLSLLSLVVGLALAAVVSSVVDH